MTELDGLLVIDKPGGMTSRDVVDRAQGWFPRRTRIGHTGTLDPLATGVLVLCVGAATRLTEYVQRMAKVYRAGVTLGAASDTDDADGTITPIPEATAPALEDLGTALREFSGDIEQTPPAYSAAKVRGRRAYDLARRGEEVVLAPRRITIHTIDVVSFAYPCLELEVRCGKGTYIRSLRRDLGTRLGCGGYITSLRRLAVGHFRADQASSLDIDAVTARQRLLPLSLAVSELPKIVMTPNEAGPLLHGGSISHTGAMTPGETAVFDEAGRLLAIVACSDGKLRPTKVFA